MDKVVYRKKSLGPIATPLLIARAVKYSMWTILLTCPVVGGIGNEGVILGKLVKKLTSVSWGPSRMMSIALELKQSSEIKKLPGAKFNLMTKSLRKKILNLNHHLVIFFL